MTLDFSKYVFYCPTSPSGLRWATARQNGIEVGTPVGTLDKQGRWSFVLSACGEKKRRYCHRVVYELLNGSPDGFEVDHKNGLPAVNDGSNLRVASRELNARNAALSSANTSGVCGVAKKTVNGYDYYVAHWVDLRGSRHQKNFSVQLLGDAAAFCAATSFRQTAIAQLNAQGAGYTDRHGT